MTKAYSNKALPAGTVLREWRVYFDRYGVPDAEQHKVASAFRHIDEVSTPGLRKRLP